MADPVYIVITPVRNEANHIGATIKSMIHQTILPKQWIIVNDGSTDRTSLIVDAAALDYSWIRVVHRHDRGFRKPGGGVIEAFYDGYSAVGEMSWDFLVKLDGDLSLNPDYFQKCFTRFAIEPDLGIGGGTICLTENGQLKADSPGDPPFHVRGATKIYRRACWRQINPLVKAPGWDTIDEVKANMHGWSTRTFRDLNVIQLKATGSADGTWGNWFKNGIANYITGYHPLFMLAKCIKRTFERPLLLAALALWLGFFSGYLRGIPRIQDRSLIRYLRKQQLRRLVGASSIYG